MLEPRLLASLTVLGLGVGLGVGLMLAKVLTYAGYAISIFCAALSMWIYANPLKRVFRSITSRTAYKGPPTLREMIISFGLTVALVIVASIVLPISLAAPPNFHKAVVQTKPIENKKLPSTASVGSIWTTLANVGDLDATDFVYLMKGHIATAALSDEQARAELDAMENALGMISPSKKGVLTKTQDALITVEDIPADKWSEMIGGKFKPATLEFTDAQWADFMKGVGVIYLFAVAKYRDEGLENNQIWRLRFCGYFIQATTFWHNCAKNAPEKITAK